jgi:UPF0716 family protein affecting phage T7 exclusion
MSRALLAVLLIVTTFAVSLSVVEDFGMKTVDTMQQTMREYPYER